MKSKIIRFSIKRIADKAKRQNLQFPKNEKIATASISFYRLQVLTCRKTGRVPTGEKLFSATLPSVD